MSYRDFKHEWPEGMRRIDKFYLSNYNFKGKHTLEKVINYFSPKRKIPYNMHPYGKSMFWMLSIDAAMYVVNTVENDPNLVNFFKYSWASDEFTFQTILLNSAYKDKVVNDNYRYIDWSLGGPNPKMLDEHDYESIKKSDMLFARKLDIHKSAKLFDLIDTNFNSH